MGINIDIIGKMWFKKHQKKLVFWLNAPILGIVIRVLLDIRRGKKIVLWTPDSYHQLIKKVGKKLEIQSIHYTYPKYSKAIVKYFGWCFILAHYLDEFILDIYIPKWSFGFYDLISSPQTGYGATNYSCDGWVEKAPSSGQAYEYIRVFWTNTIYYYNRHSDYLQIVAGTALNSGNLWIRNGRILLSFNLSSIPAGSTCDTGTVLRLRGSAKDDPLGGEQVAFCGWEPYDHAGNIECIDLNESPPEGDYINWKDDELLGASSFSAISTSGYSDFFLNFTMIENYFGGTFPMAILWRPDYTYPTNYWTSPAAWQQSYVTWYSSDKGAGYEPQLAVNYTANDSEHFVMLM